MLLRRCLHLRQAGKRPHRGASLRVWPGLWPLNRLQPSSLANLLLRELGDSGGFVRHRIVWFSSASIQGVNVTRVVRARLADNGNRAVGGKNVIGDGSPIRGGTLLREANSIIHNGFDLCFNLALNSLCQDVFLREIDFLASAGV